MTDEKPPFVQPGCGGDVIPPVNTSDSTAPILDVPTQVAQKLQASRTAHASFRFAKFEQKNYIEAKKNLEDAMRLRQEAIALDPQRNAPAWRLEQKQTVPGSDTHDALLAFYESELAKF